MGLIFFTTWIEYKRISYVNQIENGVQILNIVFYNNYYLPETNIYFRTFFLTKGQNNFGNKIHFFYKWPFPSFAFLAYYSTSYWEVEVAAEAEATWLKEQSIYTYWVFKN